ncbi:hypothetical protein [Methylobacterium oxalidis]|uniref:hypothetical protein n=1 Tax=Methylobacterium oxalidis TaxID=944322 RepID=UPI003315AF11
MTDPSRFPPPWCVVELEDAFRVEDADGLLIAHVRFIDDPERHALTGRLSRDEAWQVALQVANTPTMQFVVMELDKKCDEARAAAAWKKR